MILPGDHEKIKVRYDLGCADSMWCVVVDPTVAKIESGGNLEGSIELGSSEATITIRGLNNGTTYIELRKDSDDGEFCTQYMVRVGGGLRVEYDRPPAFNPSGAARAAAQPARSATDPTLSLPVGTLVDDIVLGGLPHGTVSGQPFVRGEPTEAVVNAILGLGAPPPCTFRVTLKDADGRPKRGRPVRCLSRDGHIAIGDPSRSELPQTNALGYVDIPLRGIAAPGDTLETYFKQDNLAVLVGRAASDYGSPGLTEATINSLRGTREFPQHIWTGYSVKREGTIENAIDEEFVTMFALGMPVANNVMLRMFEHHLEAELWADPGAFQGTVLLFTGGQQPEAIEVSTDFLRPLEVPAMALGLRTNLAGILTAYNQELGKPFAVDFAPPVPAPGEPDPPGWGDKALTVGAIALEIGSAMVPGVDAYDILKETLWKPLFQGEETNWAVAGAALFGLLFDAGYIVPPAGAAGNFMAAVAKVIVKRASPKVVRALLRYCGDSAADGAYALLKLIQRIPAPGGYTPEWALSAVQSLLNQFHRLDNSLMKLAEADIGKTLKVLADKAARHFSDDAAEGVGGVIRHASGGSGEGLIRNAFDAMPANVRDASMESVAEASGKTLKRNANTTTGAPELKDIQRVEEGLGAIRAVRTAHFRSAVLDEIGPGKAFQSMEEFEALRFMGASDLRTNQVEAMIRIRNAVPPIALGDPIRRVISDADLDQMLLSPGTPGRLAPNLAGFASRADDVDDVIGGSSSVVVSKLRLQGNDALDPTRGYAVIEANATPAIAQGLKTPKSMGFLGDPARDVPGPGHEFPYVGNGWVADLTGRLRPEFYSASPVALPGGALLKKYRNDGTLEATYQLVPQQGSPSELIWELTTN